MKAIRAIWDWLLGRRVSRLDEALAAAIERGVKHDDAMERRRERSVSACRHSQ